MRTALIALGCLSLLASVALADEALIFDATKFRSQEHPLLNLRPVRVVYGHEFWPRGTTERGREKLPPREHIEKLARGLRGQLVCLDIEHWPIDIRKVEPEVAAKSLARMAKIVDWMRAAEPSLRLGFYRLMPIRDVNVATDGTLKEYQAWTRANAFVRNGHVRGEAVAEGLADKVDVVFPSLYTFRTDPNAWRKYAVANLEEARKFNKQVYPFIWPTYHNGSLIGGEGKWPADYREGGKFAEQVNLNHVDPASFEFPNAAVSGEFWRMQLEICAEHADGAMIWTGSRQKWKNHATAAWWEVTQAFLQEQSRREQDDAPAGAAAPAGDAE
jgi:hypothetical protein